MINEGLTVVELHSKLLYALCFKACSEHIYTLAPGLVQSTYTLCPGACPEHIYTLCPGLVQSICTRPSPGCVL